VNERGSRVGRASVLSVSVGQEGHWVLRPPVGEGARGGKSVSGFVDGLG
jgi:hypothetical protein